jgi:6-bladed beta-propeller protein/NHL repeat-containing protein
MKNNKNRVVIGIISLISISLFTNLLLTNILTESDLDAESPQSSDVYDVEFVRSLGSHDLRDGAFKRAGALAMNSSGYLYIYDEVESNIQVFNQTGDFIKKIGELGTEPGNFSNVEYMAFNDSDYLYVAEAGRIQIFDPDMNYINSFNSSLDTFFWPEGLFINSTGHVYVADAYNHSVQIYTQEGTYLRCIGGNGAFSSPRAIQINSTGYIYVLNDGNNTIQIYDPSESYHSEMVGVVSVGRDMKFNGTGHLYLVDYDLEIYNPDTSFNRTITSPNTNGFSDHLHIDGAGNFYCRPGEDDFVREYTMTGVFVQNFGRKAYSEPDQNSVIGDIAINGTGYYYISDSINHRIQIYSPSGQYLSQFGEYGTGPGQFDNPKGIDINATGHVYVTDSYNDRVVIFDQSGNYVSDFGEYGSGDGEFRYLEDVVVNDTGYVYVADRYYERIQYFTPNGTFLGNWNVESTSFSEIYSLDVNSTGHVFVTDEDDLTEAIQIYTWNGTLVHSFGDKTGSGDYDFSDPKGIALDTDSNIYATDTGHHRVLIYDSMGNFLFKFGQYGTEDGEFANPSEIMVNSSGYIHVVDGMYRVQIFKFSVYTGPAAPTLNIINPPTSSTGIIDLAWSEPTLADNYSVYRHSEAITNQNLWAATRIANEISAATYQDSWQVEGNWWYAVVAHNENGDSTVSINQMVSINLPPPAAPSLSAIDPTTSTTGIIDLAWTEPALADNYTVYRYSVEITDINLASATEIASEISAATYQDSWQVEGNWWYAVIAHSETGTSLVSNSSQVLINLPTPDAPSLNAITPTTSSTGIIDLAWTEPVLADNYTVYRYSAEITDLNLASATEIATEISTALYQDNWQVEGEWWYAVIAHNETGISLVSNSSQVIINFPNASIPILNNILPNPSLNGTITLNWNQDPLVTNYTVLKHSQQITPINKALAEILTTGLGPNTYVDVETENGTYWYAVIAFNSTGTSAVSESKSVIVAISPNTTTSTTTTSTTTSSTATSSNNSTSNSTSSTTTSLINPIEEGIDGYQIGIIILCVAAGIVISKKKLKIRMK